MDMRKWRSMVVVAGSNFFFVGGTGRYSNAAAAAVAIHYATTTDYLPTAPTVPQLDNKSPVSAVVSPRT